MTGQRAEGCEDAAGGATRTGASHGRAAGERRMPDGTGSRGGVSDRERLARAALTRVMEPGDVRGGRWLRECGGTELMRRIATRDGSAEQLSGMTARRLVELPAAGPDRRARAGPGGGGLGGRPLHLPR